MPRALRQATISITKCWTLLKIARNKLKKLKSHKLENLCKYYGIVNENAHRATDDAVATAKVFKKLAAEE